MQWSRVKSVLVGRPIPSEQEEHQLLPKTLALPVFASDALSSVAYATEEMMLVLALAGASAFDLLTPISAAVAGILLVVVISYRQTIRAYPNGGGAFIVSHENLGLGAGMVAAAALLIDYVLTVAVSIAAGVAAITSAVPALLDSRVWLALGFIVLLTFANLRGVREASMVFSVPTYLFVASVFTTLVAGFVQCADGTCPVPPSAGAPIEAEVGALSLFLILRAFASGSTALTGVEAIANGVQAFRHPKSHNAAATLGIMGIISISMFLGISTLARILDVRVSEATIDTYGTVLSQIGRAVFGGGFGFYVLQVFTAAILVLAANTAFQDFPRLSAILADHRLMPRQFRNRGDRLVFSNGVVALAALAGLLVVIFGAEVTRLIQLYVVGVFTSFTLSQTGMVRHWLRTRERAWRRSVAVNLVGAVATGVVLVVVATVKFTHGAWIVIALLPLFVLVMSRIRNHYTLVADQLSSIPAEPTTRKNRVVVLVAHLDEATDNAIRYARSIGAESVSFIHAEEPYSDDVVYAWQGLHPGLDLELLPGEGRPVADRVIARVREERDAHLDARITVVLAERLAFRSMLALFTHRHGLAIKARLLFERNVVVTDFTLLRRGRRAPSVPATLVRSECVVLISDLTRPIREAVSYAAGLGLPLRAVHIAVEARQTERVLRDVSVLGPEIPFDLVRSPFRGIVDPLKEYLHELCARSPAGTVINVVLPEFIVPGRWTQFLHNQTALAIKAALAPEQGIVVTSVPFHLSPRPAVATDAHGT